jgi:formate dehydrogenase iron-sulfur subunit
MLVLGNQRVAQLKTTGFQQAMLYNPDGVGGTGVITVLAHGDHPEWYGLPRDPHVPSLGKFWKSVLRPLGIVAIFGAVIGAFGHYMNHGRKGVKGAADHDANLPDEIHRKGDHE